MPAGHTGASLLGYLAGTLLGALAFDALERRLARKPDGPGAKALRSGLLAALLLPGLFCMVSFLVVPYTANLALNTVQPFFWGATLPVALRLFFRYAEPGRQALFFGIAVGAGHLAWALLMPLALSFAADSGTAVLADALHNRFLPFLNVARVLSNSAFAVQAWLLVRSGTYPEVRQAFEPDGHSGRGAADGNAGRVVRLLLPLVLCFTVSGMLGYLFFARVLARGAYAEYMHLVLAVFFPFCGLLLSRHGAGLLRPLLCLSVLCFAAAPLLPRPDSPPGLVQGVFMVCAAGQQALFFFGTLALSRLMPHTRHPALTVSLAWLAALAAIPGNILASRLLPALGLSPYPVVWILAGLCLLSLLALRRAFPLPVAAALPREDKETPAATDDAAKLAAFVTAFGLTAKETEVMAALSARVEPASIAQSLGLSERTVRHHLTNVSHKVGTANRKGLELFYVAWRP